MPSNQPNQTTDVTPKSSNTPYLLVGFIIALIVLVGSMAYKLFLSPKPAAPTQIAKKANTLSLPANAVRISGCISHEGEHWVEPDKIPNGPFYVTDKGEVVAFEYMFTDQDIPGKDFALMGPAEAEAYLMKNQMSVSSLVNMLLDKSYAMPDVSFKDWNIHWTPPHAAFVTPHYDVHFFLVDKERRDQICPAATFGDILPLDLMQQLQNQNIPLPQAP